MDTKTRKSSKDFNNLYWHDQDGEDPGAEPWGIWSDGDTMWVLDSDIDDLSIYAYDMDTKARLPNEDFANLHSAGNQTPTGIWADETTMFVGDTLGPNRIYAYWRSNKAPNAPRYIPPVAANDSGTGIWSDGSTMWVADNVDAKIYAYALPDLVVPEDVLSVESVTDTMALVKVDIGALVRAYGSGEPAVSVSVLGTRSSATMYVHPDGGYARFLLLGLRPETQYTVVASYGITTRYGLGDAGREIFRTDHARLAGIETSSLTHTEATVTVSMSGADMGKKYFKFYPHSNKDEAERDYTYYLRYKANDDTVWSDPVELTLSGYTAAARLTGLDPDVYCDVQVYADPVFTTTLPAERNAALDEGTWLEVLSAFTTQAMPPTLAFEAEMTMGASGTFDGYDSADPDAPIGSISPGNTFEVGGVQYTVDTVGFNTDSNEFELRVDPALPFDSLTLTLAANQFPVLVKNTGQSAGGRNGLTSGNPKRAQAFTTGSSAGGYTLGSIGLYLAITGSVADIPTAGNELTVTLNEADEDGNPDDASVLCTLTDPASFPAGLHVYTFSAPTTGAPCPTLAASTTYFVVIERVVPPTPSTTMFLYRTRSFGEDDGGAAGWSIANHRHYYRSSDSTWILVSAQAYKIEVSAPAVIVPPLVSPSISIDSDGVGFYTWSGTSPDWGEGATVDVRLEVPLIDICDRSPAVAHAIKAATPSFDYCHMTSPLDLAGLTELDLPNGRGTGLKVGDFAGLSGLTRLDLSRYDLGGLWPQLPVGVFDDLDSLTHLDISHTHLMSLDRSVFDGLDNLVELDLTDTLLRARYVPVGVFDDLDSLEILRMAYGGYQDRGITFVDEDIFRGLGNLRELDVRPIRPPDDVLAPLTSLETLNGQDLNGQG